MVGLCLLILSVLLYVISIISFSEWRIAWVLTTWFIGLLIFSLGMHYVYEGIGKKAVEVFDNQFKKRLLGYIGSFITFLIIFYIAYPIFTFIGYAIIAFLLWAFTGIVLEPPNWLIALPYFYWPVTGFVAFLISFLIIPIYNLRNDIRSHFIRHSKSLILDTAKKHHKSSKEKETVEEIERAYDIENGVYLTNQNWGIFKNFIENTNKSLDIMTNVISAKTSLSLLDLLKNRKLKIRILTRRILKADFNKLMELKNRSKFDLEIYRCSRLHAKVFIRDGEKAIIGSPNFTHTSIGEEEKDGYVEGYYVTDDKGIIKSAKSFFNSIWSEKDITIRSDKFLTSKRGGIPKKIIEMIKSEKEELSVVMNSSLIQLNVIDDIIEKFNKNLRLRIITNWPSETNSEIKEILYHLRDYSNLKSKDFELVPKKQTIHAKIYIFKSKKLAFISSMNLHRNSWLTSFEAGVIIDDKKEIEVLLSYINSLETIEAEDIETNENIGLTPEESEEADRQAASVIQTKKIPFPLEGESWINTFTKTTRVKIKRFKRILKRLSREGKERTKGEEIPWMKPSIYTGLEAKQIKCKICRQRDAVNYPGMDICDHCKKERHIKEEPFTF